MAPVATCAVDTPCTLVSVMICSSKMSQPEKLEAIVGAASRTNSLTWCGCGCGCGFGDGFGFGFRCGCGCGFGFGLS